MIFFGYFGSILPYMLYLTLIWLCILVGFRENFVRWEKSDSTIEITDNQLDIIQITEEYNSISYYDISVSESNNIQKYYTFQSHTPDIITFSWKIHIHALSVPIIALLFESSQNLRGPPYIRS